MDHTRSPGRGTARAPDVRHLLRPLRAERTLGADAAARTALPVVPRRERRRRLARGRGHRAPPLAAGRLRPRAPRRGPPDPQRPEAPAPRVDALPHDYASDRYAVLRHGGGGAATSIVCGTVRFGHPAARNLVALLPRTIVVEMSNGPTPAPETEWMHATLRLIAAEASALRPGGEAVITRLSDILVIQAIRAWIAREPEGQTGWLGASARPAHRPGDVARPPRSRAAVVGGVTGAGDGDVALGLRRPLHRARGRAGHALRDPLAHAGGTRLAPARRRAGRRAGGAAWATSPRPRSAERSSARSGYPPAPSTAHRPRRCPSSRG